MNSKNTIIGVIVLAVVIVGGYFLINKQPAPEEKEPIKIGAVLPFTGSSGITGESSKNGLELALEEINNKEGIDGRKIEIIYEDSQTKTEIGLSAFKKLRESSDIKVVFTSVSGVALAIAPLANEQKVLQMDVVSAAPAYSTPSDFTFRTGVNSYAFAGEMSKLLIKKNIKEIALLFVNTEYGVGYKDVFIKDYESNGGKIIATESYNQGETDFRTIITKIKNSSPKALVLISLQKETPVLLQQMEQMQFNVPIFTDVYAAELPVNLDIKISENIIYLKPIVDLRNDNNSMAKDFATNYLQKYGREPDFIAAQAYDGLRLAVNAMENCGSPTDAECIKDNLYKIKDFRGVIGSNISFDINGDIANRPLGIMTIKNGQFVPLENQ